MGAHRWLRWLLIVIGAVLLAGALIAISGAAPELAGGLLLLAFVVDAGLYAALYVLQRRRHG